MTAMRKLCSADLDLEPLTVAHADDMFALLSDPALYDHLDHGPPPSVAHLRGVYAKLERRASPDGREQWLNWIVRPAGAAPVGYVQATVFAPATAWVAYVVASRYWGRGYAHAAAAAMIDHLAADYGVTRLLATVEVANLRSLRLLARLGFRAATAEEARCHDLTATERHFVRELA